MIVDRWGTWLAAAAPIRDDDGTIVGLVSASRAPKDGVARRAAAAARSATRSRRSCTRAGARQTRVEIESMIDALTGLYNHRRFHELLRDTVEGAREGDDEVALLFCDIDRFKQLNDRHGHLAGDDVLRRVSRILAVVRAARRRGGPLRRRRVLRAPARHRDWPRRWTSPSASASRSPTCGWGRTGRATISIGVAVLNGHRDAEDLLEQADKAMYAAKQAGRDRVVRADTLEAAAPRLTTQL